MKIDWWDSEKIFFTDELVKRQITDSINENLTDSDLESTICEPSNFKPFSINLFENYSCQNKFDPFTKLTCEKYKKYIILDF